jgi:uncharacterized membrane protein (DUF2068 family)
MTLTRSSTTPQAECASLGVHASHLAGLRAVASIEIAKGLLALVGAIALLTLLHKDLGDVAENIIEALHLNPAHRIFQDFIDAAGRMSESRLIIVVSVAAGYAMIRFIEAYGLWHARAWAEWFAIISGASYLPLEIIEVARHPHHIIRWGVLIVNIFVVLYMMYVRWDELTERKRVPKGA